MKNPKRTERKKTMADKIELSKIPSGGTFSAFGEAFVVLEHFDGGVLSIRKDIWKSAPFDKEGNNKLPKATIYEELKRYIAQLKRAGMKDGDFFQFRTDLKATDGSRAYGFMDSTVSLLTLEQYGKYKEIIPLAEGAYWLATPWGTPWLRSPGTYYTYTGYAWSVFSVGGCNFNDCSVSCGVRPALTFNSSLLVSAGEPEEGTHEAPWKKDWADYIDYLEEWCGDNENPEGNAEEPPKPMTYEEWEEEQ